MANPPRRPRAHPRLEQLETRLAPSTSAWLSESFDATAVGALPSGWAGWGGAPFAVSSQAALSPAHGLASAASSAAGRAWLSAAMPADIQAGAALLLGSSVPGQVFVRGSGLGGSNPSYYALSLGPGLHLQLVRVLAGRTTVLAQVQGDAVAGGPWVRVVLDAMGPRLRALVVRVDTGAYLNPAGHWQAAPVWALTAFDGALPGAGQVGLARAAGAAGTVTFDDFALTLPNAVHTFDATPAGTLPASWAGWTSGAGGDGAFRAAAGAFPSGGRGLTTTAGQSNVAARAWVKTPQPADVQASVTTSLDTSAVPVGVLLRGSGLDSATPSYYALTVSRGLLLELVRVVNGVTTPLAQLRTTSYFAHQWVRITLVAAGATLRAQVYRLDTGQYLNAAGGWQAAPGWALTITDTALDTAGLAGVVRVPRYTGSASLDDFTVYPLVGDLELPQVSLVAPASGATLSGTVTVEAQAADNLGVSRVEFYVDNVLRAVASAAPYRWSFDTTTAANGPHTLSAVAYDAAGNSAVASVAVVTQNATALTVPNIPRHYDHIRIAELAYGGTPFTSFEDNLLRNSVDLVVSNYSYAAHIAAVAPTTPQLLYTNVSNLYQDLLLSWLTYADAHGLSREEAFYHAAQPVPFTGTSASSQPVNWFWGVFAGGPTLKDDTAAAHGGTGGVTFAAPGQAVYVGYPEQFREINVQLATPAGSGWSAVAEYATAVDAAGHPTAWAPLPLLADGTAGLTRSGRITFDPPAGWVPSVVSGTERLYYIRFRTMADGTAPVARTILGRDYVGANGSTSGVIPVFDYAADVDHDGYLNDTEYAVALAHGDTARFAYESRLFDGSYGQMRFATNPGDAGFRAWAEDYLAGWLASHPLAAGLFVDNSGGVLPADPWVSVEPMSSYAADYASLLNAIAVRVAPHWLVANTGGAGSRADPVVQRVQGYFEEFGLRPLSEPWPLFDALASEVAARLTLRSPAPYAILDSLPAGGSPTDPRTELATLAEYYLMADPVSTFLDFFGGYAPATSWTQHWVQATAFDVGQPLGGESLFASGADPSNPTLTYHVYERQYTNALVLYKPLSYGHDTNGTLADNTATTHLLPGTYRVLQADGTLGPAVTSVTLRNGEGVILVKSSA
jgi:hypothetical protein